MKAILRFLIVVILASVASCSRKPAHLFILSGQSNIFLMDPALGFEPEAALLFPNARVAYIKVAQGGHPIRYWVSEWDDIAKKHGIDPATVRADDEHKGAIHYQTILDQFAELLKKHPNPASVTFCWMQGELDALDNLDAPYADALKQLIANLRRDLKRPDMKIVIGRLSDYKEGDGARWEAVRQTQVNLATGDPFGAWVDCDDLNNTEKDGVPFDDLHYTKEGFAIFGRRCIRQAKALIEGRKPAENGRP